MVRWTPWISVRWTRSRSQRANVRFSSTFPKNMDGCGWVCSVLLLVPDPFKWLHFKKYWQLSLFRNAVVFEKIGDYRDTKNSHGRTKHLKHTLRPKRLLDFAPSPSLTPARPATPWKDPSG